VSVRDTQSQKYLETLWISSQLEKDSVFFDAGDFPKRDMCLGNISVQDWNIGVLSNIDIAGKMVWIAFRSGFLADETQQIREIVEYISQNNGNIIFLPHSFHEDNTKANDLLFLQAFCTEKNISLTKNMHETYEIYTQRKIDFCLSMRLHSGILCQVYEIPFLSIAYAKKSEGWKI